MTSHATPPATSPTGHDREPLRLMLSPSTGSGAHDGAWWPQSRDLDLELADLVDNLPTANGRVSRALFSRPDWDGQPRKVAVAGRQVKTGSFPADDTHLIVLRLSSGVQLRLLVVPAGHPAGDQAMAIAADPENRWSAAQILDAGVFDEDVTGSEDHWTDHGGTWWSRPEDGPPSYRTRS